MRSRLVRFWYRTHRQPRVGPVRYMFPFVLGFTTILAASALNSVSYSYVRVAPSATTLTAGDRFSVDIYAYAHEPVNAVDITLAFQPDAVEIQGVDTGRSVITLWTEDPSVSGGTVVLRGGTYKRGFRGEHLIGTVTATAKKSGQAEFFINNLTMLAGDGKGTPVLTGTPEQSKARIIVLASDGTGDNNLKAEISVAVMTDIDGDGLVALSDVSTFLTAWHRRSRIYDFNSDGKMTFRDFAIILSDSFLGTSQH
jgi:hypothetical protein